MPSEKPSWRPAALGSSFIVHYPRPKDDSMKNADAIEFCELGDESSRSSYRREQGRAQLEKLALAPWVSRRRQELLELLDRMNPTIEELTTAVERG